MNYELYEVFHNEEYKKLLKEKSFLEKETRIREFTFLDMDGKVTDRQVLNDNQYEKLSERERQKLMRYKSSRSFSDKAQRLFDIKNKDVSDFYIDFRSKVKNRFIDDFSAENNISREKTIGLLKYSLSLFLSFYSTLSTSFSEEDIDSDEFAISYDDFIKDEAIFYASSFKKLSESMINTLSLFKVMGVA